VPVTLHDGDPLTPHQRYRENVRFWTEQLRSIDLQIEAQELELCELRESLGNHAALQDLTKSTRWPPSVETHGPKFLGLDMPAPCQSSRTRLENERVRVDIRTAVTS
jgi:hypothetical protein